MDCALTSVQGLQDRAYFRHLIGLVKEVVRTEFVCSISVRAERVVCEHDAERRVAFAVDVDCLQNIEAISLFQCNVNGYCVGMQRGNVSDCSRRCVRMSDDSRCARILYKLG